MPCLVGSLSTVVTAGMVAQESCEGESTQCVLAHTSAVPPTSHRDSSVRYWDCSLQLRYLANENTRFARVLLLDYPLDLIIQVLC